MPLAEGRRLAEARLIEALAALATEAMEDWTAALAELSELWPCESDEAAADALFSTMSFCATLKAEGERTQSLQRQMRATMQR